MSPNTTLEELTVNYTSIVNANEQYAKLLEDLMTKEITLGTSWSLENDLEKLGTYFEKIAEMLMQLGNQSQ